MHKVVPDLFSERDFEYAQAYAQEILANWPKDLGSELETIRTPEIYMLHEKLWSRAQKEFNSPTLLPSWAYLTSIRGVQKTPQENFHDRPCTYGIVVPLYQTFGWDLEVQGHVHSLSENEGLFYPGNASSIKRDEFLHPETNVVVYGHFFFVEPDHWWFTEEDPEKYLWEVIRAPKQ